MQFEIILRTPKREYYIVDRRSSRPSYSAFDCVSADQDHTIAPTRKHALEVAQAYREYIKAFPSFALPGVVVTRPYKLVGCAVPR